MRHKALLCPLFVGALFAQGNAFAAKAKDKIDPCRSEVVTHLANLGIDRGRVSKFSIVPQVETRRGGDRVVGYEGWISFAECDGNLVISMSRSCGLRSVYSRGGCNFADVPPF